METGKYVWFPNPQIQFDFLTQNSVFEILSNLNGEQTFTLILVDISTILLSGYDINAKKTWEYWEASRSDSWKNVRLWSPQNKESELTKVFPGFL